MSDLVTEEREVGRFTEIALGGVGRLTVALGDAEALTVEAQSDVLPHIITRVEGNRLVIRLQKRGFGALLGDIGQIHYRVTARALDAIAISGAATVTAAELAAERFDLQISGAAKADLNLTADRLETQISGAGRVTLRGKTDTQRVTVSGAATYRADELASRECRVVISGAGTARVNVEGALTVRLSGAGRVFYTGNPTIDKRVSGVGQMVPIAANR
jgi:hypothetical protein